MLQFLAPLGPRASRIAGSAGSVVTPLPRPLNASTTGL